MMKKRNKILAILLTASIAYGVYALSQLQIFVPARIQAEMPLQNEFKANGTECFTGSNVVLFLDQKRFRMLTWNIHKGADAGWQPDLARFSQGQDLVLLQEAAHEQVIAGFPATLLVSAFAYQDQLFGVKTFARFVPQTYCGFARREPWIRVPKAVGAMTFPLKNGSELLVINVHLINFEWHPTNYRRQLEQVFTLIRKHQGAVILAGDFNAWNAQRKQIIDEFAMAAGLQEVRFSPDQRVRFLAHPLDYVFVRGLKVISAKTEKVHSSDHAPLWVEVELD